MSDGADCLMHKVNVFGVEKPFYVPRFHFPRLSDQKMCLAQPVTTELHTSAKHHGALTGFQQLPCKPVWIKYVKTYADCVAHAQDYRVESACCIWDRTNSPCQTKKERNSVWQTNGSFPASESDFWRRGCSGGLPGLLSSIHQPVHPPGKTGGTVYEGSSATLGLPPQQQRNGCTHQARGDGWRVSMQR